jgi:cysteine-S-conjugate beta-lyase
VDLGGFESRSERSLRERASLKWSRYDPDVLPAWVAEMDFGTAPAVVEALRRAVEREDFGYARDPDRDGLPNAAAAYFAEAYDWRIDPASVQTVDNVIRGVALVINAFSPPGAAVVLPTPAYPPFFEVIAQCNRPVLEVPVLPGLGLDLDAIDHALAGGAGTVLICNPHNPTGRMFGRDELAALAEVVERRGARAISDEVHAPLGYFGRVHVPYPSVSDAAAAHSVTLTSASKGWNLPGLKCGQVVLTAPADAQRWRDGVPVFEQNAASPLGVAANRAAYTAGAGWLADVVGYLAENRRLLGELLAAQLPAVGYRAPDATYLAWLDCRPLGLTDPAAFFLERARVAVADGANFGEVGRGFVRLNFGTVRPVLTEMIERMGQAIRSG